MTETQRNMIERERGERDIKSERERHRERESEREKIERKRRCLL